MKTIKKLVCGAVLAVACLVAPKAEALDILNGSLINGTNMMNGGSALYTNVNNSAVSNIYMQAGALLTNATAFQDFQLQKNWDGTTPDYTLCGSLVGTNAATTNNVSFLLRTVPMPNGRVSTETTNSVTFAINMNGTNPVVFAWPIPKLAIAGAKKIRPISVTWTLAAGAGNSIIERLEIVGGQ